MLAQSVTGAVDPNQNQPGAEPGEAPSITRAATQPHIDVTSLLDVAFVRPETGDMARPTGVEPVTFGFGITAREIIRN